MMRSTLSALLLAMLAVPATAQVIQIPPQRTVATLPPCSSSRPPLIFAVTDAESATSLGAGGGSVTVWVGCRLDTEVWTILGSGAGGGGGADNSFETVDAPTGTDPVADSGTDTLTITTADGTVTVTGTAATDTLDIAVSTDSIDDAQVVNDGLDATSIAADAVGTSELDDDANTPSAGDVVIVEAGTASFDYLTPHAGTDLAADLEEEGAINATAVTGDAADDQILLGSGASAAAWTTIPDCNTNNMLTYTQSTNTWGCDADDGAGGGAPVDVQYLALAFDATLTAERRFQLGLGLTSTDGGANGDFTVDFDYSATLAGNPALGADEVVFTADGTGGGILWEGAADAVEGLLAWSPTTSDRTLTLPDATDTLVGRATTDTLTNKTISTASNGITVAAADISDQNGGTDITADLEEEAHASEHQEGGADDIGAVEETGDTMTGALTMSDGAGDSPAITSTPQTGTAWSLLVEDAGDDLQIQSASTASTETVDVVNPGAGVADLSVEGSVTGGNVTSGADPGHTHTGASISAVDVTDDTNLAVTAPVTLTDDTVGLNQNAGTDVTADLEEEGVTCTDCIDLAKLDDDAGSPTAGDFVTVRAGATDVTYTTPHAGTDVTADLEEESHASEHAENAADELLGENLGTACADGQIWKANATGGVDCVVSLGTGIDLTEIEDICAGNEILERNAGDTAWACIATPSGGAAEWTDTGTTLYPTEAGDEVVVGATSPVSSAKFSVDGDADQIQTLIQGNATQTSALFVVESSAGADYFRIDGDGQVNVGGATDAPVLQLDDSDTASEAVDFQLAAQATDTGAGSEDVDVTLATQVNSTLTARITIDADGDTTIPSLDAGGLVNTVPAAAVGAGHIDATTELAASLCGTNQILEDGGASWSCIATPTDTTRSDEEIEDVAGTLIANGTGTHTGITVTYQDATGDVDLAVDHDAAVNFVADEHVAHSGVTLTAGTGLSGGGDISASRSFAVASQEAGFLADGGTTSLTCGGGTAGQMQVMDDGELEVCDGAATPVLRAGQLTQSGLTWNVTVGTCTGDGNGGALTVNGSNQIICSGDDGGAGGGAPTDATYLTATPNATLSAEVVVGATPGGDLGNTWDDPQVDDDSHNHVLGNIDSFTSAALRGQMSDESGTGAAIFAGGAIGAATASTPAADDSDTSVATTAYVQGEINGSGGRSLTCTSGVCNLDAEAYTRVANGGLVDFDDTDDAVIQLYLEGAATITEAACSTDTGTATIQLDERGKTTPNTGGTDIMTAQLVCDNDSQATTAFDNASVAASSLVSVDIDAASGSTVLRIHITYTLDD